MNSYTEEELWELFFKVFPVRRKRYIQPSQYKYMTFVEVITHEGRDFGLEEETFRRMIYNDHPDPRELRSMTDYWQEFHHFLHEVPFREVPKYLSKFKEVASWRLRIGK